MLCRRRGALPYFYPRPPRGGRLVHLHDGLPRLFISIHALREEGDETRNDNGSTARYFYPRPPRGGRPCVSVTVDPPTIFLSTPSARRATNLWACGFTQPTYFYPRPPRGGRLMPLAMVYAPFRFLSTPSARRATAKTETKSLFSNKLYNILHEFRRALIYNGSKNYPNHAK